MIAMHGFDVLRPIQPSVLSCKLWLLASYHLRRFMNNASCVGPEGKREIIRCLKRFVAREIFGHLRRAPRAACPEQTAA